MVDRLLGELLPSSIVGALAAGVGLLFLLSGRRSRTTTVLAWAFLALGLAVATVPYFADRVGPDPTLMMRLTAFAEPTFGIVAACYAWALMETSRADARARQQMRVLLTLAVAGISTVLVLGLAFPRQRHNDFLYALGEDGVLERPGFWLFAGTWTLIVLTFLAAWGLVWRNGIDDSERVRGACQVLASPCLVGSLVVPYAGSVWLVLLGILITLYGTLRYHIAAGERSAFLSRFLAPEVSVLVDAHGLAEVMKPHEVELTVVACDLRGFTAYAEAVPSQSVIDLLGDYYEAVGQAVAEHDGTIKDYAGDGVLILVGAPLPRDDHAAVGLTLAHRLLAVVAPVLDRWSTAPHPLGLGVGVAAGRVSVGAIGSSSRMEYTAVGTAVNLASRLCSAAQDGEILASGRVVELAGAGGAEPRGSIQVKGLSSEQQVYAVLG